MSSLLLLVSTVCQPRAKLVRWAAASDGYKRQGQGGGEIFQTYRERGERNISDPSLGGRNFRLSIILDSLEAN